MAMMDSFFSKAFKAAKCRTLLKLTIPRIKLLRNRREIQIKNMRKEIAKLLETGQEATARIKVEHIIREEKMMAAQEIVELFCELITVRLPIIETQRECPLDLKEAISSVCFAAPRCADLTELLQVQMLFAAKYGKEFVAAATELRPECGVNRQLIEMLSIRAPPPEVKLKLLKEIAEEHELDWDPSASESELLKPHEDLLNGPAQFVSASKLPVSQELHDEPSESAPPPISHEQSDSDDFETIDFPEVPTQPLRSMPGSVSAPEMLPFPASALSDGDEEAVEPSGGSEISFHKEHLQPGKAFQGKEASKEYESSDVSAGPVESKQFLPFISPPSQSPAPSSLAQNKPPPVSSSFAQNNPPPVSFSFAQNNPPPVSSSFTKSNPPPVSRTRSEINVDLQDVLAAAQAAAESAERAAAAARSAASLAQLRISELVKGKNDGVVCDDRSDDPSYRVDEHKSDLPVKSQLDRPSSFKEHVSSPLSPHQNHENNKMPNIPSYDDAAMEIDPSLSNINISGQMSTHQFQRLPSMDDDPFFSYPNLFTKQNSNLSAHSQSFTDKSGSTDEK